MLMNGVCFRLIDCPKLFSRVHRVFLTVQHFRQVNFGFFEARLVRDVGEVEDQRLLMLFFNPKRRGA